MRDLRIALVSSALVALLGALAACPAPAAAPASQASLAARPPQPPPEAQVVFEQEVAAETPYVVGELSVTVASSAMAMIAGSCGEIREALSMKVRVTLGGEAAELTLSEGWPVEWRGYWLECRSLGFGWSAERAGTLRILR